MAPAAISTTMPAIPPMIERRTSRPASASRATAASE
jgi:hypothetical protein